MRNLLVAAAMAMAACGGTAQCVGRGYGWYECNGSARPEFSGACQKAVGAADPSVWFCYVAVAPDKVR